MLIYATGLVLTYNIRLYKADREIESYEYLQFRGFYEY